MNVVTTEEVGPSAVTIRSAKRADLLDVLQIEKASFPQPWPYEAFRRLLDATAFLVAEPDAANGSGPVIGYLVGDITPVHQNRIGHIKDIAVHPDARGRGIGSALLQAGLSRIATEGVERVKLEVRESNEPAVHLYRSHGFEFHRTISEYYDDGEDALIFVRDLS
ncbi:MAG: ribosomal protein S18-alanine N-acetyltransferase [Halobacteriaceae archaeon]